MLFVCGRAMLRNSCVALKQQHQTLATITNHLQKPCCSTVLARFMTAAKECRAMSCSLAAEALSKKDPEQAESMKNEYCIVVDRDDNVVGKKTKTDCHLMTNIRQGLLHRAFSVLMFNQQRQFLLTQRADEKITFPSYFTNACCSHPAPTPEELDQSNDFVGIKRAAQRRLHFELGINPADIPVTDIHFMTRFLYVAPSEDPIWGEHELDYILIIKKELQISPNTKEVKQWLWVSEDELNELLAKAERGEMKMSSWFYKIAKLYLPRYWANLDNLDTCKEPDVIHKETVMLRNVEV